MYGWLGFLVFVAFTFFLADDPRATALAMWRVFRFPWGLVFGGMFLGTLFDRGG